MTPYWTKQIHVGSKKTQVTIVGESSIKSSPLVSEEESWVKVDAQEFDPDQFCQLLAIVIDTILATFPEIELLDAIVDQGIPSIEVVERIESLQAKGIQVTLVDLYEYLTTYTIASFVTVRMMLGGQRDYS